MSSPQKNKFIISGKTEAEYRKEINKMAQREEITNNYTYLVVKHHSIVEESKTEKEGFEPVDVFNPTTKETTTKYIDKWGAVTGFITGIEAYDTGDAYKTRFQGFKLNIDEEVILDLPQKTPSYDAFCKLAENIDFDKEVTLSAYHNRAKDRTGFSVKQNGQNVNWKYTMDDMGDCPPWEKDEDGEWDSRKQRAFLKAKVIDTVIPACDAAFKARKGEAPVESIDTDEVTPEQLVKLVKAVTAGSGDSKPVKAKKGAPVSDDDIPF